MVEDESREAAAERLAEEQRIARGGALARWAGRCARHPWRVVSTWVGIFVVLIGLNAAFHGKLINDFKIPGSDTQKATDLITAKFGGAEGRCAPRRARCAAGRAARHARAAKPPSQKMLAAGKASQRALAREHEGRLGRSRARSTRLGASCPKNGRDRVLRRAVRQDRLRAAAVAASSAVEDQLRAIGDPAGDRRSSSRARPRARRRRRASSDLIGLLAAFIILMVLFRALVPTVIPAALRDRRGDRSLPDPVPRRPADALQHRSPRSSCR